ncbi:MAG: hypothetical protein AAFW01_02470 [Pseudomonadota bacterium]
MGQRRDRGARRCGLWQRHALRGRLPELCPSWPGHHDPGQRLPLRGSVAGRRAARARHRDLPRQGGLHGRLRERRAPRPGQDHADGRIRL